jgi:hypothetical protein
LTPNAKRIQLVSKSVKDFKNKSYSTDEFAAAVEDSESLKNARLEFAYKNIIAIPHLLTQVFLSLESTDPLSVAMAFFYAMYEYDPSFNAHVNKDVNSKENFEVLASQEPNLEEEISAEDPSQNNELEKENLGNKDTVRFMSHFIHVIQFCHLCYKDKISLVFYTLATLQEIKSRFNSLITSNNLRIKGTQKSLQSTPTSHSSDDDISSPESKISRKDKQFLSAMLKIHDTLERNMLRTSKDREEK